VWVTEQAWRHVTGWKEHGCNKMVTAWTLSEMCLEEPGQHGGCCCLRMLRSHGWWTSLLMSNVQRMCMALLQMMAKRVPGMEPLILRMRKAQLLPAIWFILSRKVCLDHRSPCIPVHQLLVRAA
jgi:hypothetical protein